VGVGVEIVIVVAFVVAVLALVVVIVDVFRCQSREFRLRYFKSRETRYQLYF